MLLRIYLKGLLFTVCFTMCLTVLALGALETGLVLEQELLGCDCPVSHHTPSR